MEEQIQLQVTSLNRLCIYLTQITLTQILAQIWKWNFSETWDYLCFRNWTSVNATVCFYSSMLSATLILQISPMQNPWPGYQIQLWRLDKDSVLGYKLCTLQTCLQLGRMGLPITTPTGVLRTLGKPWRIERTFPVLKLPLGCWWCATEMQWKQLKTLENMFRKLFAHLVILLSKGWVGGMALT